MPNYRRAASKLDMYRKGPTDLMEGTKRGSLLSYFALITMLSLFLLETKAFLNKRIVSDLALDSSRDDKVRLNFNITMLDIKCEWYVLCETLFFFGFVFLFSHILMFIFFLYKYIILYLGPSLTSLVP